ncbi:unnamed protein product, partial [Rotaria magnacalcarata]
VTQRALSNHAKKLGKKILWKIRLAGTLAKPSYGIICSYKDESIHYFSLPTITESSAMYSNHYSHLLHVILTAFHFCLRYLLCARFVEFEYHHRVYSAIMLKNESLPNELLLYLFEFIDGFHLFNTFYKLNARFHRLRFVHFRAYHINFCSISKYYLPSIVDPIISDDDDETSNLSEILLSNNFTLDKFTCLQSLSIYSMCSTSLFNTSLFD